MTESKKRQDIIDELESMSTGEVLESLENFANRPPNKDCPYYVAMDLSTKESVSSMTCEYCAKLATHRTKAPMGPPVFVCEACSKDFGPLHVVSPLEADDE